MQHTRTAAGKSLPLLQCCGEWTQYPLPTSYRQPSPELPRKERKISVILYKLSISACLHSPSLPPSLGTRPFPLHAPPSIIGLGAATAELMSDAGPASERMGTTAWDHHNTRMWESTLCELRRGVASSPHLSDSEVLIPVEKGQQIRHVISQLETPALPRWCNRHQWRWLQQERRAYVHLQDLRRAWVTPDLHKSLSCTWHPASIPASHLGLCGHDWVRGEVMMSPDAVVLPLEGMVEATWLNCHRCEVHKNLNSPPNDMDLNQICQPSLRCESLGAHEDDHRIENRLISYFTRANSIPILFFKVQPNVYFTCAKASVCRVPTPYSPGHCVHSVCTSDHCGALHIARHPKNRAESSYPWEETFQDYNHNDCLLRTTVDHPCHPTATLSTKSSPDCIITPHDAFLRVLPTVSLPESSILWHSSSAEWTTIDSDPPLEVGAELDADTSGEQISQCADNGTSSSDISETEDSDSDDAGTDTSDTSCQHEFSDGHESLSERTGYWCPLPILKRSRGVAHLHAVPSASSEEHNASRLRKRVSFFEEVTVFIFDKEAPTQDLKTPCSSVDMQSQKSQGILTMSTSGHAGHFSAEEIHCDEDDLEWEDDFCTALPLFPVLMEANRSSWSHISDTSEHPRGSACFRHDWVNCSTYTFTHITDSDLE
ncbi:uncharacterized protein LOC125287715 isoform X3 [Alosa alosa]|uniref:uncharacterized protein LOC125287715 isoform X3 n=1 Tax=Alosa alosa TaxID=278164 RepID=UPI00201553B5|nr:uncharacterized protein LOC125287715 isoform X3 [Alosa alosa]